MRIMRIVPVFLAALACAPAVGHAAKTDQEIFEGKVGRFTVDPLAPNPKRLCVCINDSDANDNAGGGVVVQQTFTRPDGFRRVLVQCWVRRFNATGDQVSAAACSGNWIVIR
jgi:hypothetical protein